MTPRQRRTAAFELSLISAIAGLLIAVVVITVWS